MSSSARPGPIGRSRPRDMGIVGVVQASMTPTDPISPSSRSPLAGRSWGHAGSDKPDPPCQIRRVELWTASVDVQLKTFERMVTANPIIAAILQHMPELDLRDCWLTAGCLFQTVWNTLSNRDLQAGILDYDVNYFDASDLSWDAENRSIRRATNVFADLEARIEVRNEARVHLWYEAKFGTPCPPYRSTAHAVSTFPNCSSCVAVRPNPDGLDYRSQFRSPPTAIAGYEFDHSLAERRQGSAVGVGPPGRRAARTHHRYP